LWRPPRQKLLIRAVKASGHWYTDDTARPAMWIMQPLLHLLEVMQVGKSVNEWCKHCDAGKGCIIYDHRTQMCRLMRFRPPTGANLGVSRNHDPVTPRNNTPLP
jgi:hypothetical protein